MALLPNPVVGSVLCCSKNVAYLTSTFVGTFHSGRLRRPILSSSYSYGLRTLDRGFQLRVLSSKSSQEKDEQLDDDTGSSFLKTWGSSKQKNTTDERAELREEEFQTMLQIPREARDRLQRMQVVDRAAAAVAAINALLADHPPSSLRKSAASPAMRDSSKSIPISVIEVRPQQLSRPRASRTEESSQSSSRSGFEGPPGPDFWSWVPPPADPEEGRLQPHQSSFADPKPVPRVVEKDRKSDSILIPFETEEPTDLPTIFQNGAVPSRPPLQSLLDVQKEILTDTEVEPSIRMPSVDAETVRVVNHELHKADSSCSGVHPDGSMWWQVSGVEYRENGVVCNWTIVRGVSAEGGTEWEMKFWEASDPFDYKELGAEKSGRDSSGRVWHEFWKEAMWQDVQNGLQYMEKTADKWGKDGTGGQWSEKWFEHYDATGRTEKWADKWSQIDSNTPLEPGHAHTWHERWGQNFDGQGGSVKYTDKWAERKGYGDKWTKWGDKWDEHFDKQGHGVKQGETWWEGTNGEKWNRTWGEEHNGTGWVHKYGKSSSGEHWDTHVEEETWYERKPHFGFRECFDNSGELPRVKARRKRQL